MEHTAHVSKTALPGVGTRYDLNTDSGRHISVVVHQDGRRIVAFHDPEDDDACKDSTPLAPHEATALSKLLMPDPVGHLHQHLEIDLVTEHIPVTKRSPSRAARSAPPRPVPAPARPSSPSCAVPTPSPRPPRTSASHWGTRSSSSAPGKAWTPSQN